MPSPAIAAPLLEARAIERHDARTGAILLRATNFALAPGDRAVVTGPSGAGKSVLLRALALLEPPDQGVLLWRGAAVEHQAIPRYRRAVAYVRQRPAMFDGSVEDNLRYPFSLRVNRGRRFDLAHAGALATKAGRDPGFLDKHARDLSGGESQIVALLRVLLLEPAILLLDEPTASLDPDSVATLEALVDTWFHQQPGERALAWVSHDIEQARRVGTRQFVMQAARLSETDAPSASRR